MCNLNHIAVYSADTFNGYEPKMSKYKQLLIMDYGEASVLKCF